VKNNNKQQVSVDSACRQLSKTKDNDKYAYRALLISIAVEIKTKRKKPTSKKKQTKERLPDCDRRVPQICTYVMTKIAPKDSY
jgi:hypothetical protein